MCVAELALPHLTPQPHLLTVCGQKAGEEHGNEAKLTGFRGHCNWLIRTNNLKDENLTSKVNSQQFCFL